MVKFDRVWYGIVWCETHIWNGSLWRVVHDVGSRTRRDDAVRSVGVESWAG